MYNYEKFERLLYNLLLDNGQNYFDVIYDEKVNNVYTLVIRYYNESHRYYHTIDHIEDCLTQFNEVEKLTNKPNEIKFAIWFHDVCYDPQYENNEGVSKAISNIVLASFNVSQDVIERISSMILATKTHEAYDTDSEFMLDVDLSILGADENKFNEYEENIRKEYSWAPEKDYKNARKNILQNFLNREYIFHTDYFRNKLEDQAYKNIERSIEKLG